MALLLHLFVSSLYSASSGLSSASWHATTWNKIKSLSPPPYWSQSPVLQMSGTQKSKKGRSCSQFSTVLKSFDHNFVTKTPHVSFCFCVLKRDNSLHGHTRQNVNETSMSNQKTRSTFQRKFSWAHKLMKRMYTAFASLLWGNSINRPVDGK